MKEIQLLSRIRHVALVAFIGYCRAPEPVIVLEYCARGSLFSIMRQHAATTATAAAAAAAACVGLGGITAVAVAEAPVRAAVVPLDPGFQQAVAVAVAGGMAYLHSRSPPVLHLVRLGWDRVSDWGEGCRFIPLGVGGSPSGGTAFLAPAVWFLSQPCQPVYSMYEPC